MENRKTWYTCDRCGTEIKKLPTIMNSIYRKFMPIATFEMKYAERQGYISNVKLVTPEIAAVSIIESVNCNTKRFDLCPKCRKDFERFMKNG